MLRIGPHTSRLPTPDNQRSDAQSKNWTALQTHWGNTRSMRTASTLHGLKMTNPDPENDPIWSLHTAYPASVTPKPEIEQITATYLANMLDSAHKVGARYVVVHVGGTKEFSAEQVADRMRTFLKKYRLSEIAEKLSETRPVKLLVENTAALYPFNQNLLNLVDVVLEFKGIGWCIDTAHTNAAGIPWEEVRTVVSAFPPDLAHINFPGSPFSCGRDRHGWRTCPAMLAGDEVDEESDMGPAETAEWDATVKLLNQKGVPLILEGSGWTNSNMSNELSFVRNMLQTEEAPAINLNTAGKS